MKILLLCNKVPFPAKDGSSIAIKAMAEGLMQAGAEVHMMALNTRKHHRSKSEYSAFIPAGLSFEAVGINTDITPFNFLYNLLEGSAFHVSRFYSTDFAQKLEAKIQREQYDWVQLEGLTMAVYLPLLRKHSMRVALRAHNVEHQIWDEEARNQGSLKKRAYLSLQTKRLKKFEYGILHQLQACVPISPIDEKHLAQQANGLPFYTVACGIDTRRPLPSSGEVPSFDLCYLASMDWLPNRSGLEWFMREVYPKLQSEQLKICIAGRAMPKSYLKGQFSALSFESYVDDVDAFMQKGKMGMIPLLSGSGMRIKLVENLYRGIPMVSTYKGAEGVAVQDGEHIFLADDPTLFAERILELAQDESLRQTMSQSASAFARKHFDQVKLAQGLLDFYAKTASTC